jgi:hypothetical protein
MFSIPYPTIAERQAYEARARRLRASVMADLFSRLGRRLSDLFGTGWISTAAR